MTRVHGEAQTQTCALPGIFIHPQSCRVAASHIAIRRQRSRANTGCYLRAPHKPPTTTKTTPLYVCVCCQNASVVMQVEVDGDGQRRGAGGGGHEVRRGKNSISYQLLPVRPLRGTEARAHRPQKTWHAHAMSDGVFPPEAKLKHPISLCLVYLRS